MPHLNRSESNEIFTGEVTSLAFGGQGIIRQEGFVVFVPFTAIGDRITYRIINKKKSYANGELLSVLQKSAERTTPLCPYFEKCGGCQLQHLTYQAQLEHKKQCVEDALKRIGHLKNAPVSSLIASQQQYAYRRHINLTLRPKNDFFEAGYIASDHRSLLEVEVCPIFTAQTALNSPNIIKEIQAVSKKLKSQPGNEGKVSILKQENGQFLLHFHFKHLPPNASKVLEAALTDYPDWAGVALGSPHKTLSFGNATTTLNIEGLRFTISPHAFIQNHPEQSLNIYHEILKIAAELNAKNVLDLYCGIGISSLLLAKQGCEVLGIESNSDAIKLARANANQNKISNVNFLCADVQDVLAATSKKFKPELVIVNPPREGLYPKVVQELLDMRAKAIVYISCMPSTLARDLGLLCQEHYQIQACQPFDMFPQTGHVETLVLLEQKRL